MFIVSLGANDSRFKTVRFQDGLNLVVAERTDTSDQRDSRNGTGKSSLVRVLRYLVGGNLPSGFKTPLLAGHEFWAELFLPGVRGDEDGVKVSRAVSPTTRFDVRGWSATEGRTDIHVDEWRSLVGQLVWALPEDVESPSTSQLWSQMIRNFFSAPTKVHNAEAGWETAARLGYFLGLDPAVLSRAGELTKLTNQRDAIKRAIKDGVLNHLALDEANLRARLATLRRNRDRVDAQLRSFRVDEQYAEHQAGADAITTEIRALNDEALVVERRLGELSRAVDQEAGTTTSELQERLARVYKEVGIVLPELVGRRFEEVQQFHQSVISNRRAFLHQESDALRNRMSTISSRRAELDHERSQIMVLLQDSVALDTFIDGQASLSRLEAELADVERRLHSALAINEIDDRLKLQTAETVGAVRAEITERSTSLDWPISLFNELGAEIYADREANLLIQPSPKGLLSVTPQISGDASEGIRGVETFLLDIVCLVSGIRNGRAPGLLVHDSHLFDAVDHRQVAACLNIGARLAGKYGFQYLVTMNSDFLHSVVVESDRTFDPEPYQLDVVLTDKDDDGGLFGFSFE